MQTNSWFFVPLLLQVAGLLDAPSAEEWRAHPVGGQRWERLSKALVAAPAVADFLAIVHGACGGAACKCRRGRRLRGVCCGARPPTIDATEAVLAVCDGGRCVPALAQSAILQVFGGAGGASEAALLARLYGEEPRLRSRVRNGAVEQVAVDEDRLAEAAARAAGPRRGRGQRGKGRGRGRAGGTGPPLMAQARSSTVAAPTPVQGGARLAFWRTVDFEQALKQKSLHCRRRRACCAGLCVRHCVKAWS